jgi:hypothetical protein
LPRLHDDSLRSLMLTIATKRCAAWMKGSANTAFYPRISPTCHPPRPRPARDSTAAAAGDGPRSGRQIRVAPRPPHTRTGPMAGQHPATRARRGARGAGRGGRGPPRIQGPASAPDCLPPPVAITNGEPADDGQEIGPGRAGPHPAAKSAEPGRESAGDKSGKAGAPLGTGRRRRGTRRGTRGTRCSSATTVGRAGRCGPFG